MNTSLNVVGGTFWLTLYVTCCCRERERLIIIIVSSYSRTAGAAALFGISAASTPRYWVKMVKNKSFGRCEVCLWAWSTLYSWWSSLLPLPVRQIIFVSRVNDANLPVNAWYIRRSTGPSQHQKTRSSPPLLTCCQRSLSIVKCSVSIVNLYR